MTHFNPEHYLIFNCIVGSQLYGTATPDSDTDYRGICIPPVSVLLHPFDNFEQKDSGFEEEDRAIYALAKFLRLCADNNPNIVELLFVPKDKVVFSDDRWWKFLAFTKQYFISKNVRWRFAGYAISQLEKIKRHKVWFTNPPSEKPTRKQFGLTDTPLVSGDGLVAMSNMPLYVLKEEYKDEIVRELEYRKAKKEWDNFVSWRDNRNPSRKRLEEQYGFDVKCALHLFRLIEEGRQLLLTGEIKFPLENAEELKDILHGKYTYEQVLERALTLDKDFDKWYNESTLPAKPNREKLADIYFDIVLGVL